MSGRSIVAGAVGCLALAGCGGSSKPTISKAQFLSKGNAICTNNDAKQTTDVVAYAKAHHISLKKQPTRAQLTAIAAAVAIPDIQASITSIRALGAPKGDEQKVKSMLDGAQQALDQIKSNPSLLLSNPFHSASQQLHAYGLTQCAKNG